MGILRTIAGLLLLGIALFSPAGAQEGNNDIYSSLRFQDGHHDLGEGLATLKTGTRFRYLNNEDTQKLLTKVWGNPPGAGADSLGAIVPVDIDLRRDDAWVAVIGYEPSGHVSDEDANGINYDDLLKDMQQSTDEASKARVAQGYRPFKLLGWAHTPHYDANTKKLYWAKRLHFGDNNRETLNYNIRILGRGGYIEVNVVSDIANLQDIDGKIPGILDTINFNKGRLYTEFDPSVDEAATYGIAGLIAGGVLAKTGVLKAIIAFILAFKKALLVGLAAVTVPVWSLIKRLTGRGKPAPQPSSDQGAGGGDTEPPA